MKYLDVKNEYSVSFIGKFEAKYFSFVSFVDKSPHDDYKNGGTLAIFPAQTFEFQAVWAAQLK